MPYFYKGANPGSYYWEEANSPFAKGFNAAGGVEPGLDAIVRHIRGYATRTSPYLSITSSFAVAAQYAKPEGGDSRRGKVWEIAPRRNLLINPIAKILGKWPDMSAHLHDGDAQLLDGLLSRADIIRGNLVYGGEVFPVNCSITLAFEALVYAIRDAELLAEFIPSVCVKRVIDIQ
jgi:hypothetical protein